MKQRKNICQFRKEKKNWSNPLVEIFYLMKICSKMLRNGWEKLNFDNILILTIILLKYFNKTFKILIKFSKQAINNLKDIKNYTF